MMELVVMIEKHKSKDLLIMIIQVVWIQENLFLDMFSLCLAQQSVGKRHFRIFPSYQLLKQKYITLTEAMEESL